MKTRAKRSSETLWRQFAIISHKILNFLPLPCSFASSPGAIRRGAKSVRSVPARLPYPVCQGGPGSA